jgi:hypothetical protein
MPKPPQYTATYYADRRKGIAGGADAHPDYFDSKDEAYAAARRDLPDRAKSFSVRKARSA